MKTPIQELFEKFGHLLPNVKEEYLEKERHIITETYRIAYNNGSCETGETANSYLKLIYNK